MMSVSRRLRQLAHMMVAMLGRRPMISCEEALAVIHEFLDGELAADDQGRVRTHFDVCARCYPKLRAEESFRSALRLAGEGEAASEDLTARVRALLEEAVG